MHFYYFKLIEQLMRLDSKLKICQHEYHGVHPWPYVGLDPSVRARITAPPPRSLSLVVSPA